MNENATRSIPGLLGDLGRQIPELIRKEAQLLRAEAGEKMNQAATAVGLLIAAVVFALTALNVLAAALVAAIANAGLDSGWAALIVGGLLAVVAFALAARGSKDLKASSLTPQRTVRAVSRDAEMAKEKAS